MPGSAVVDIRNSSGAVFIGLLVSTALLGLTIAQTWVYFWNYWKKDTKRLKFLIAFITVLDVTQSILCTYATYWYLVLNFGNVQTLGDYIVLWTVQSNIGATCITAVQLYYTWRIYLLRGSTFWPFVILFLIVGGNIIGFYIDAQQYAASRLSKGYNALPWLTTVSMWNSVVVDSLITTMMCWSLYRKKTGFAKTDSIVMTLMAYSINSGLLVTLLDVALVTHFMFDPHSLITLAIFLPLGKCYVNALLAMLNSRDYLRDRSASDNSHNSFSMSSIRIEPPSEAYASKREQIHVTVHHSTTSHCARNSSNYNVRKPLKDTTFIPS